MASSSDIRRFHYVRQQNQFIDKLFDPGGPRADERVEGAVDPIRLDSCDVNPHHVARFI